MNESDSLYPADNSGASRSRRRMLMIRGPTLLMGEKKGETPLSEYTFKLCLRFRLAGAHTSRLRPTAG